MALLATNTGNGNFEISPAGNHIARCYMVCDLGWQETEYQGVKSQKRQVRISFELPNELMESEGYEGQPFSVSKTYTLSLNEKATLRQHLEAWRGKAFTDEELQGFDLFVLLGIPAMVNVVHKVSNTTGNTYAMISSIGALPKGMECPPAFNKPIKFSLDEYDEEDFSALPEWLQDKINCEGYENKKDTGPIPPEFDDDVPF